MFNSGGGGQIKDRTGETHGLLKVVRQDIDNPRYWHCECKCGNTKKLMGIRLKITKSCGCLSRGAARAKARVGNAYGFLFVEAVISYNPVLFRCKCQCGNIVNMRSKELKYRKDCGCKAYVRKESESIIVGTIDPRRNKPDGKKRKRILHKTRGECGVERPCPFVSCKYHLFLDVTDIGTIKLSQPGKEVWELEESCVLDLILKKGTLTLQEVADLYGISRERVRQIESIALKKLYKRSDKLREFRGGEETEVKEVSV